jgi:hypothetical protein
LAAAVIQNADKPKTNKLTASISVEYKPYPKQLENTTVKDSLNFVKSKYALIF